MQYDITEVAVEAVLRIHATAMRPGMLFDPLKRGFQSAHMLACKLRHMILGRQADFMTLALPMAGSTFLGNAQRILCVDMQSALESS